MANPEKRLKDPQIYDGDKPWLVTYSVECFPDQVRGYDTKEEAEIQMADIAGFAGVSEVCLVDNRKTLMQSVSE